MGARSRLTVGRATGDYLHVGWDPYGPLPPQSESLLRPSPAKLGCDARAVLASARRIRWSICAPHAGQFDVGVTLFLEVPFRQLWCITSLSRKKCPRLTGPRQAWCAPHLRGSAFGLVPGEVLAARIISARMPVPNPRMKTGSRVLDARLMASKFSPARFPSLCWRRAYAIFPDLC